MQHFLDNAGKFSVFGAVNALGKFGANRRTVRGDLHHAHFVNLPQLARTGRRGARHAGQTLVAQEVILNGHAGGVAGGDGHWHVFLGFDRLMQTVAPLAAFGQPAGEFIDNHNFAVADHVVTIENERNVGPQRPFDGIVQREHADLLDPTFAPIRAPDDDLRP